MILPAIELGQVRQVVGLAVDARPHETLLAHRLEHVTELTLAAAHQRREHFDLRALRPFQHQIGDLGRTLPFDRRAVIRAMGRPGARPEQPQVVVDLGDRSNGGPRIRARGLLLDRDRR